MYKTSDYAIATYFYAKGYIPEVEGEDRRKMFVFNNEGVDFEELKTKFLHYQGNDVDCRSYSEAHRALKSLLYEV